MQRWKWTRSGCGGGVLEDYVSVDSLPPCMWYICFDIGVGLRITCFACMLITIGDSTSTDYVVRKQGIRGSNGFRSHVSYNYLIHSNTLCWPC